MDTKLKKTEYSVSSKVICFILSCVFVAIGTASFLKITLTRSKDHSNLIDAISFDSEIEIDETISFAKTFQNDAQTIILSSLFYKDGSLEAFKKVEEKIIKKKYDEYINHIYSSSFGEYGSDSSNNEYATFTFICNGYCNYNENGTLLYFNSDGNELGVPKGADRLWIESESGNIYSVKFDKKKIYQICIDDLYKSFSSQYNQNEYELSRIKNLKFAIVNNTDKTFVSNIDSLNIKSSQKDIEKEFKAYSWNFSLNSNGTFLTSDEIKAKFNAPKEESVYSKDFNYSKYYNSETPYCLFALIDKALADFTSTNYNVEPSTNDSYIVYFALDKKLSFGDDAYSRIMSDIKETRQEILTFIPLSAICLLLSIGCIIFLIVTSGRKEKNGEIKLIKTDKHLTVLHLILSLAGFATFVGIPFAIYEELDVDSVVSVPAIIIYLIFIISFILAHAFLVEWTMSFARNIKNKSFFKNTLAGQLIKRCETLSDKIKPFGNKKTFKIICASSILIYILIFLFAIGLHAEEAFIIPLMLLCSVLIAFIIVSSYYLGKIITIIENAKDGKYDEHFKVSSFPFWMRSLANEVLNMQDGTKNAIESAIKDQKMKTELITNVSHDLKTPLTAVINYVDLLSKCELDDEKTKEYIDVICKKSDRLKKLIEDLTEAAKASSGNIQVNSVAINLNEIAYQISGETEDEFKKKNLEIILKTPENPVIVNADSKLTFRVLENLMGNALKYSMPNTRVYFIVNENGSITINNISKEVLDVTPEELKSRFFRGDKSRTTEGSGLGLSIADDLCKIQNAKLEIFIEGDLFKTVVTFSKQ